MKKTERMLDPRFELSKRDRGELQPYFDSLEASAPVYNAMKLALEGKLYKAGSAEKEALQQFLVESVPWLKQEMREGAPTFSPLVNARDISERIITYLEKYEEKYESN